MKASFRNLTQFVEVLERAGELVRIKESVSADLEISEITDRVSKMPDGGKALLFENVNASSMPVLINAFGSPKRMALALGRRSIRNLSEEIAAILKIAKGPAAFKGLASKLGLLGQMFDLAKIGPRRVSHAPCQEIVLQEKFSLNDLPILKCWPGDASRFITLGLVITKDPDTGDRNMGIYRMQVLDERTTAMHWQTQKDGAIHSEKEKRRKARMPVAVAIGADPATVFSGVAPLPFGMDELLFSGFLRGEGVEVVRAKTVDLEVPAQSEIVLEGYVDPEDTALEGPFGDHTGVYTPPETFPKFHAQCITMRKNPIYLTTIVGKPPMEDFYMGKAVERAFFPILKTQVPELVDMNFPMEGTFNNAVIVSIDKQFPFQARKVAHAIWGMGQLSLTKFVIIVDKTVDVANLSEVALAVFNNIDPKRDLFFVEGPVDTLNHAAPMRDFGSKVGMDATAKMKEEGYTRLWPDEIKMDAATRQTIDALWPKLGL